MFSVGAILIQCMTKEVLFPNLRNDREVSQILAIIVKLGYPPEAFIQLLSEGTIAYILHMQGTPAAPIQALMPGHECSQDFIDLLASLLQFGLSCNLNAVAVIGN